ncbi:hypothetical protein ACFL21_02445 [Patescibacteria group bacterium]
MKSKETSNKSTFPTWAKALMVFGFIVVIALAIYIPNVGTKGMMDKDIARNVTDTKNVVTVEAVDKVENDCLMECTKNMMEEGIEDGEKIKFECNNKCVGYINEVDIKPTDETVDEKCIYNCSEGLEAIEYGSEKEIYETCKSKCAYEPREERPEDSLTIDTYDECFNECENSCSLKFDDEKDTTTVTTDSDQDARKVCMDQCEMDSKYEKDDGEVNIDEKKYKQCVNLKCDYEVSSDTDTIETNEYSCTEQCAGISDYYEDADVAKEKYNNCMFDCDVTEIDEEINNGPTIIDYEAPDPSYGDLTETTDPDTGSTEPDDTTDDKNIYNYETCKNYCIDKYEGSDETDSFDACIEECDLSYDS